MIEEEEDISLSKALVRSISLGDVESSKEAGDILIG